MRTTQQRQADVISRFARDPQVWVATASDDAAPHLVPVSFCWHRDEILLATRGDRALARDVVSTARARLRRRR